ncbi:iron chelate uptake ABC transporter family permease subunit [Microbacterium sp.]|uniref:iron chelate uptake ABC transporter family permease subunit n=1 Tax=Microbacterium sp. TaxID=51671 RepID=UPI0028119790|nr:iron chelate uptake ABC transporter family permease subunit [Microbacterium sp.]
MTDATRSLARPVAWSPASALLRDAAMMSALAVLVPASIVAAVTIGPAEISPAATWGTVLAHVSGGPAVLPPTLDAIVWQIRLPRALTAAAVGAGLALCGAVLQSTTRNSLADPFLLGISAGASLGAACVILLSAAIALPLAAFAGASLALAMTLALARDGTTVVPGRAILAGVAVSAFFGSLTSLGIFWFANGDSYREILGWLLGSLAGSSWTGTALVAAALLLTAPLLMGSARTLDAFLLGDHAAASLGVSVVRARWMLLVVATLLTAIMVSVSGSIGFVGLVVPHAVRLLGAVRHRLLLPCSALGGAVLMVWADTAARSLFEPRELPVGVVTALLGAPAFGLLLLRRGSVRARREQRA